MNQSLMTFILFFSLNTFASEPYCLAIRGNGELAPAHWGGIARLIELLGVPEKQAGGSSATVTMALTDAAASSPFLVGVFEAQKNARASLMIKSFEGFLYTLSQTRKIRNGSIDCNRTFKPEILSRSREWWHG